MAFNPFHVFRKHKKVLFAGLTIICMFTFVLSSGLGGRMDLFTELPRWLGFSGGREKYIRNRQGKEIELYGSKVAIKDLEELRRQRTQACTYLQSAFTLAAMELDRRLTSAPPEEHQRLGMQIRRAQQMAGVWGIYQARATSLPEMLDFLIWRRQAERLGIELTDADVATELKRLTGAAVEIPTVVELARRGQSPVPLDEESAYKSLGEEFRAWMAEVALTGVNSRLMISRVLFGADGDLNHIPAAFTPYDFWQFYKEQRTSLDVALLPIRAEDYLDLVKDKPTDEELRKLFVNGNQLTQNPRSSKPGFMEPDRIQAEWVSGRADHPAYRCAAEVAAAVALFGNLVPSSPMAGFPAENTFNLYLFGQGERLLEFRLPNWLDPDFIKFFYNRNIKRAENVAAWLGRTVGADRSLAALADLTALYVKDDPFQKEFWPGPASALVREADLLEQERKARLSAGLTAWLATFGPTPDAAASILWDLQSRPRYLPPDTIKKDLLERLHARSASQLLASNLKKLREDLKAVATSTLPAEDRQMAAEELVANAIQDYHLTGHGATQRWRHQHDLDNDRGLSAMKESYLAAGQKQLATLFFPDQRFTSPVSLYEANVWPFGGLSDPLPGRNPDMRDVFLYWKTAQKRGRQLAWDDVLAEANRAQRQAEVAGAEAAAAQTTVRAEVEKAWRLGYARKLAEEAAGKLKDKAAALKGDLSQLRDLAKQEQAKVPGLQNLIEPRELDRVVRRKPRQGTMYEPYRFPENLIPYARTSDFLDDLMKDRKTGKEREKGDAVVLEDEPKRTYYVAVILERQEPSYREFYQAYKDGAPDARPPDQLLAEFIQRRGEEYRRGVIHQLRFEAGVTDESGIYPFDDAILKRFSGQADTGDSD
jgi:hypothetical protein